MSTIVKGIIGVVEITVGIFTGQPWLIAIGVSTLIATAASLINPTKKSGGVSGLQTQIAYDPSFPRQLIVGRTITAGSLVAQFTHDSLPAGGGNDGQNRVLELVIALADHECDALEQIIVNGQVVNVGSFDATLGNPITHSLNPVSGSISVDYTGKLWVMFHSGANGQAVDAHLHSVLGAAWPATSVGTNMCYVRATCVYDAAVFGGIPQLQFVLRGAKLYDPRNDTTVGGSGSQRWGTPSTYAWTDNLAVIAYNVCRGIYVGGNLFFGASATADEIPFSTSVAAMNACDEDVPLKAGGTEKRYAGGGQVSAGSDAQTFLGSLSTAMAGHVGTGGGSMCLIAGVAQTPVMSFTDDDIMAREPYDNAPKFGFAGLKNAVFGTFVDPNLNWTRNTVPTRTSSSDITEDGGLELSDTYSFDLIYSHTQAQRVMEIIRQRNRRQKTQTVTLRPSAMAIERGDWVQWTSAQWGYSSKNFFVLGVQLKPNLDTVLSLVEIDTGAFAWTPSTDELPPAGGLLPSADPPADALPAGVTANPLTQLGDAGRENSSFLITFDNPNDATLVGFQVEYRVYGTTNSMFAITQNLSSGILTLPGLIPNTLYEYRYQFIGTLGRVTPWSSWFLFTSPSAADIANEAIDRAQLSLALRQLNDFVGQSVKDLLDLIQQVSQGVAESGFGASSDLQTIRRSLSSTTAKLTATFDELILVATGPDSAIASELTTLSATFGGTLSPSSTVSDALVAQASAQSATASALTSLTSEVGNFSASGLFRVATAVTPTGADARIALSVSATSGGGATTAAIFLDAMTGGASRLVMIADQVSITNGTDLAALSDAFEFIGGVFYAKSAVIPILTFDHITGGTLDAGSVNAGTLNVAHIVGTDLIQVFSYAAITGTIGTSSTLIFQTADFTAFDGWRIVLQFIGSGLRAGGHSPDVSLAGYRDQGGPNQSSLGTTWAGSGNSQNMILGYSAAEVIVGVSSHTTYEIYAQSNDANVTSLAGVLVATLYKN